MSAFKPYPEYSATNQALDGSSHAIALPRPARSGDSIYVAVDGSEQAYINTYGFNSSVAAAVTNAMIPAGAIIVFPLEPGVSHVAVYGASGSTVQVLMGCGD